MALRTYGNISYSKEESIWIIDKAEPHVCIKLKAIFPKIGATMVLPFKFPDTLEFANDMLWFMERYPLSISEIDLGRIKRNRVRHKKNINDLEAIMLPEYTPVSVQLKDGFKARNYQLVGKDIYLKQKRLLIADDLGLGKTLIAILSCLVPETKPCMVVMQTHLPKQWKAAIEMFTNLKVCVTKGKKPYNLPAADIYLMAYTCVAGWTDTFQKKFFKSSVFDECQELRRKESQKYEAAKVLSNSVEYCLGLSATPIYNLGNEIFNVLDVINPGCLGKENDFLREWCGWGYAAVKDPQALGTYLRENFLMLRRTRKEVGRELPPINKIVHTVGYDEDSVKDAEEIAKVLAIRATTGSFVERGQAGRELDILMRQTTGISKAKEVAEYVKILLESGEPVVLAGWHRECYRIWLEELKEYKPVMYTGSESSKQKEEAKQAFINGETNLFIISLRSGIGLDGLQQRCNMIVIGELDWSPKVHDQLIGRIDRDGQQEQVTAIFLVSEYGSDPLIIDMLGIKSSQSHNIINPLTAVDEQYSDQSRIKLLAERFLDKNKKSELIQTEIPIE